MHCLATKKVSMLSGFVVAVLLLCASIHSFAQVSPQASKQNVENDYAENYRFDDPTQRKDFLELTAVLRCPMCQNQNIADSDAMIAHDMRRKVYQLMQEGKNKDQVIDFMKQRYGDFVYYQPPVNSATIWLWLLPIMFAFVMLFAFVRRKKKPSPQNLEEKLAQADRLLKENE